MKTFGLEAWEQNKINSLTLKMILASTLATVVAACLAYVLQKAGITEIRRELLFAPWGIALVVGISIAFHQGVLAERERIAKGE